MLYLIASGIDIANDQVIAGMESVLGQEVVIFGATSSDQMQGVATFQAVDGTLFQHAAFAVGFWEPGLAVETQASHGFVAVGEPMVVTRSEGNRIIHLDGEPAWPLFLRRLGLPATAREGDTIPIGALAEPLPDLPRATPGEIREPLLVQQAQIDDASAEDLAFLVEALRQAGAVEVFSQAILMKKGRPGTLLSALVPPDLAPQLRAVWWRHGTTLGVREQRQQRWRLPRESFTLATPLGVVRLKRAWLPGGGERCKPEYEDLAALAHHHGVSLQQVRAVVAESMAGATMESRP
jgi:hypothetical protein